MFKWIWTQDDFDKMSWHDCKIHAIAFDEKNDKLLFDIDFIFEWIALDNGYKFSVSPATLVFENVWDLVMDVETEMNIDINCIQRCDPKKPNNSEYIKSDVEWEWTIEINNCGNIRFRSIGFKLYIRQKPICKFGQKLDYDERGGYSFSVETKN